MNSEATEFMKIHDRIKKKKNPCYVCMYVCVLYGDRIILVILGYTEINILSRKPGKYSFMWAQFDTAAAGSSSLNHCSSHCSCHLPDLLNELIHLTQWEEKKPFFLALCGFLMSSWTEAVHWGGAWVPKLAWRRWQDRVMNNRSIAFSGTRLLVSLR